MAASRLIAAFPEMRGVRRELQKRFLPLIGRPAAFATGAVVHSSFLRLRMLSAWQPNILVLLFFFPGKGQRRKLLVILQPMVTALLCRRRDVIHQVYLYFFSQILGSVRRKCFIHGVIVLKAIPFR